MNKLVINKCYGGFGLSNRALSALALMKGGALHEVWALGIPRHDPDLIEVVERFGEEASGSSANLVVVTIPGRQYRITEYDGYEGVETPESMHWDEYPSS